MTEIVIGIDPGYDRMGWAVCQVSGLDVTLLALGCITTNKHDTLLERFSQLRQELAALLEIHAPHCAAIESLFFAANKTTAVAVAQARGIILSECLRCSPRVYEYTPLQLKQAVTGDGRADKKAVEKMVRAQVKISQSMAILDDTIDAVGLCLTYAVRARNDYQVTR